MYYRDVANAENIYAIAYNLRWNAKGFSTYNHPQGSWQSNHWYHLGARHIEFEQSLQQLRRYVFVYNDPNNPKVPPVQEMYALPSGDNVYSEGHESCIRGTMQSVGDDTPSAIVRGDGQLFFGGYPDFPIICMVDWPTYASTKKCLSSKRSNGRLPTHTTVYHCTRAPSVRGRPRPRSPWRLARRRRARHAHRHRLRPGDDDAAAVGPCGTSGRYVARNRVHIGHPREWVRLSRVAR